MHIVIVRKLNEISYSFCCNVKGDDLIFILNVDVRSAIKSHPLTFASCVFGTNMHNHALTLRAKFSLIHLGGPVCLAAVWGLEQRLDWQKTHNNRRKSGLCVCVRLKREGRVREKREMARLGTFECSHIFVCEQHFEKSPRRVIPALSSRHSTIQGKSSFNPFS